MTDSTPTRKSGRGRIPNRKYEDDAFDTLKLVLSSDSEDEEILVQQQQMQDDSDEFPEVQVAEGLDDEDEGEDEDESLESSRSDGSEVLTPNEDFEDAHSYASSDRGSPGVSQISRPRIKASTTHRDPHLHSRGLPENPLKQEKVRSILKLLSGDGEQDIIHVTRARDQWAIDPTLPDKCRLRLGVSHTEEQRQMEATVGWDWYYEQGGREVFAKRQYVQILTADEVAQYAAPIKGGQEFLIGPYGRQNRFSLDPAQCLDIDQAWTNIQDPDPPAKRQRRGWMLNVGSRIKCMDWAPNHDGNMQYLALAAGKSRRWPTSEPPAFTSTRTSSAIQIWAFPGPGGRDMEQAPFIHTYLCTDWGEVKQLKWCPVPEKARTPVTSSGNSPENMHIGLLAIICGDGFARVLDVELHAAESTTAIPQVQKYNGAGFAAPAASGHLSTCLAWLSHTDLAVGYSSGHLAIFDICPLDPIQTNSPDGNTPEESRTDDNVEPSPWLSMQLHSTYVLALCSAYPTHPSLLSSSSLSGHLRLTSLLAPKTDYVLSSRTRSPPASLSYCDSLLAIIGTEESSETIKMWGMRLFYASFSCAKLPAPPGPGNGIVDVGKCHSTIATGSADGSVIVTNPMRKILGRKQAGYQQCIFKHEWRPTNTTPMDEEYSRCRQGLSRITEGYKAEKVNLNVRNNFGKVKETVPITTIYEEETAVTALTWNPNLSCGGWLAVGWGSGLVRVQDVSIN